MSRRSRCSFAAGEIKGKGAVCDNPPVRQDHLDAAVWKEFLCLLEDPSMIQEELNRRREAASHADPRKQREEILRRDHASLEKSMDRLVNAYQEELVSLDQLRSRMPELRKKQSLEAAAADDTQCLRLVETLTDFCSLVRLRGEYAGCGQGPENPAAPGERGRGGLGHPYDPSFHPDTECRARFERNNPPPHARQPPLQPGSGYRAALMLQFS